MELRANKETNIREDLMEVTEVAFPEEDMNIRVTIQHESDSEIEGTSSKTIT